MAQNISYQRYCNCHKQIADLERQLERFRNLDCSTCGDPDYMCKPLREQAEKLAEATSVIKDAVYWGFEPAQDFLKDKR